MDTKGRHIVAEMSRCRVDYLENVDVMKKILTDSAIAAGAEVLSVAAHKFSPQGVSCVVVIAESHVSIHTWPEAAYAAMDVYTCGDKAVPDLALDYVASALGAREVYTSEITRGVQGEAPGFSHSIKTVIKNRSQKFVSTS